MSFVQAMDDLARAFEIIGAAVFLGGLALAAWLAVRSWVRTRDGRTAYRVLRETFGGTILLGLEVLVAADLVHTVSVAPTLENVAVLGAIVLIRTFLSFSLDVEIEGELPWRTGRRTIGDAPLDNEHPRRT